MRLAVSWSGSTDRPPSRVGRRVAPDVVARAPPAMHEATVRRAVRSRRNERSRATCGPVDGAHDSPPPWRSRPLMPSRVVLDDAPKIVILDGIADHELFPRPLGMPACSAARFRHARAMGHKNEGPTALFVAPYYVAEGEEAGRSGTANRGTTTYGPLRRIVSGIAAASALHLPKSQRSIFSRAAARRGARLGHLPPRQGGRSRGRRQRGRGGVTRPRCAAGGRADRSGGGVR